MEIIGETTDGLAILEMYWDKMLVRDDSGKEFEIFRGKDYGTDWEKLGCGYAKDKEGVYHYDNDRFRKYRKQIDLPTFELIQGNDKNTAYFKDKNAVYLDSYMCGETIIENADPNDFKILDINKGYATSNGKDFCYDDELPYKLSEIEYINKLYKKVGNTIYCGYTTELPCDLETFEIVHKNVHTVARDKNHVYYKNEIIEGADPETFRFMEECVADDKPPYLQDDIHFYAKDKNYAYFINSPFLYKIIRTKDVNKFSFVIKDGIGYGKDPNFYFEKGIRRKTI